MPSYRSSVDRILLLALIIVDMALAEVLKVGETDVSVLLSVLPHVTLTFRP